MKLETLIKGRNLKKKEENNVKVNLNIENKLVSVRVLPAESSANYKDKKIGKVEKCLLNHHDEKGNIKYKIAKDSKKKKNKIFPSVAKLESFEDSLEKVGSTSSKSRRPLRKVKNNKKYESESDEDTLKTKKGKTKRSKLRTNKIKNQVDLQIFEIEKVLRKKRNSERRKEKSRDAARCRRGKESEIFGELGALLPLEGPISSNLDKASIIRVAIAYLRTRSLVTWGLEIPLSSSGSSSHPHQIDKKRLGSSGEQESCTSTDGVLQALDGFLIVLTDEGEVVYTSENIASFLGLSQIDVIGHPLLDYIHPCDHDEVRHLASLVSSGPNNIFLRFKCTLTPKGRNVNLKSATYKVVQVTGQVLNGKNSQNSSEESNLPSKGGNSWIVALGVPVPHPSNIEVPLDKQTFVSKHSLDMKFNYVDENVKKFCGYRPEELLGRSLYQLNHALDTQLVRDSYKTLRSKGQVETGKYRFLAQGGGYVWVVTQATLISGHRDNRPQYVVCLNFVISGIECKEIIFSECQLKSLKANEDKSSDEEQQQSRQQYRQQEQALKPSLCEPSFIDPVPLSVPSVLFPGEEHLEDPCVSSYSFSSPTKPAPVAATCSLLRDRTEDMNEGYLTFTDNDSHVTILKEEPEDLTHLAPSVGEGCVPLEVPVFLPVFDDVLENGRSGYSLISNNEDSIEKIFNEPFVTSSGIENTQSPSQQFPNRLCEISPKNFHPKAVSESLIQDCFRYTGDQNSSHCRTVPDQTISSPQGSVLSPASTFGFDTPGSPFSPLLSQAASPPTPEKHKYIHPGDPKPKPVTTKLFADLDVDNSSGSSMDLFNNFDLKLEEDLELRAPYIPPIDEVLIFDQDDLFGLNTSSKITSNNEIDNGHTKKDDFSFFSDNQKGDEFLNGSTVRDSLSPNHPFSQSKNGSDTGGNFVDPNQVLPGQFYVKGDEKDNMQELRYLLEAPPPIPVKEPVDPPPPLKCSSSTPTSIVFIRTGSKRPLSPSVSSAKKWKSGFVSSTSTPLNQRKEQSTASYSLTDHGKAELPTPRAPLMQQLLVSKEPIRIGGRVVSLTSNPPGQEGGRNKKSSTSSSSSGSTGSSQSHTQSTHSVLRNLLVSGRDDRAGYAVVMSNLSGALEDDSKNVGGDKSDTNPDSPLHSISNLPVNKDGKIELTRQQLSDLLDRAGALRNGFRTLPVTESLPPTPPESYSPVMPSTPVSEISKEDRSILMVDSSMSPIPTLFNLTSFDCEVNAPTQDPSLLQGSELLMALEHTQSSKNNNNNK